MNSYLCFPNPANEPLIELITVPGRRKYWKWSDFALADADAALIVVKPRADGVSKPSDLITWLVQAISYGITDFVIVVNAIDYVTKEARDLFESEIHKDLLRVTKGDETIKYKLFTLPREPTNEQLLGTKRYLQYELPEPVRTIESSPFQLSINVIHVVGEYVVVGGKVISGQVKIGDTVTLMPPNIPLECMSIHIVGNKSVECATAGHVVGLRIRGITRDHISTGMVLVRGSNELGRPARCIVAKINFFNVDFVVREGFCPVITIHCFQSPGKLLSISSTTASLGDTCECTILLNKTGFLKVYDCSSPSPFSRLIVRQENIIVGVGIITKIVDDFR
jgi:translation elongation factor EF-1alpha